MISIFTDRGNHKTMANKMMFDKLGLEYEIIDTLDTDDTFTEIELLEQKFGFDVNELPLIVVENDYWTGYNQEKISEYNKIINNQ